MLVEVGKRKIPWISAVNRVSPSGINLCAIHAGSALKLITFLHGVKDVEKHTYVRGYVVAL